MQLELGFNPRITAYNGDHISLPVCFTMVYLYALSSVNKITHKNQYEG